MKEFCRVCLLLVIHFELIIARSEDWGGKWFPENPSVKDDNAENLLFYDKEPFCDNAKDYLQNDLDVKSENSTEVYFVCTEVRSLYESNYSISPVITEHIIPPLYTPLERCNDTIDYAQRLPTYGSYRSVWAKYGEYSSYVPMQRWLHNLRQGGIVMLWHPCANFQEVEKLKKIVKGCLYRHIISPFDQLTPEFPLAVLAWGKSLEISAVDSSIVVQFIRRNALKDLGAFKGDGKYDKFLVLAAKIVSDPIDSNLCP